MKHILSKLIHSSSYQIGTAFAVLMLLGTLFVSYWLVIASDDTLIKESEEAVRAELRGLVAIEASAGVDGLSNYLQQRQEDQKSGYFYSLRSTNGEITQGNIPAWPGPDTEILKEGLILFEIDYDAIPGVPRSPRLQSEHIDIMAKVHRFSSGSELLVGRNVDDLEIAQFVARSFGWLMILILALIFTLSYGVAYFVTSRFDRIASTTNRIIATGNLAERLPVDSNWDDLSKLSLLLNRMLAELEHRVDGIKSVSDNIAHDLRTPLMRLRAQIEATTSEPEKTELLGELDSILNIFQALLRISAIEAGKQPITVDDIDLATVARDAVELYEPLAADKQCRLEIHTESCLLRADRDLLFQVVVNLIDNALKFTPAGGEVCCEVKRLDREAVLTVTDTGPGIPEADRETVLQRFSRLDDSRSLPGNGLGLPLVRAIIHRHGGTFELGVSDELATTPGLKVTLRLPLQTPVT